MKLATHVSNLFYFIGHRCYSNSNEQNTNKLEIQQAHTKSLEQQILSASSFARSIMVLPESRAACETDNAV